MKFAFGHCALRFKTNNKSPRRGSFVAELIVAAIIAGTAMALLVPGLASIGRQRQIQKFEALARVELNNLEQTIPESENKTWALSEWFLKRYPDAVLTTETVKADETILPLPEGLRVTITRSDTAGLVGQHVSLVIWPEPVGGSP